MATKFFTVCKHTGPALPHGTSGKIVVIGRCPKCLEGQSFLSDKPMEATIKITTLLKSYRQVRTSSR